MTPPTPEELLRLARKAWNVPANNTVPRVIVEPGEVRIPHPDLLASGIAVRHERALEALHAALLVLAGELDVAALLAERDRLRAGIADTIEAMDAARAAKSAPGNEAYDEGFNMACGFSKQLQVLLDDPKEDP